MIAERPRAPPVSRHLVRARAFLEGYAAQINPRMIEYMAQQLALVLIQENTSDTQPRETTMDFDDFTIGQIKSLGALFAASDNSAWEIGANYLIRTVTMIDTGRLVGVTAQELILEDAAWIADTGRFADALENCEFGEVEPFPAGRVILGRGAIIDAVKIKIIPRSQK